MRKLILRIISKKKLRDYYTSNVQSEIPLTEWYYKMLEINASNIFELTHYFNSVDPVFGYTIFNVGGNNYHLITAIHYNTQTCYVRTIGTHAEYDKPINKEKLKRGDL
ncbi:type II toxin-antitoxin system HigB family toxin [Legionella sp. km535]|uniref:type II toxin-antitoxin system HigB family toxin n=1 Tax=Legionella sp. km535 TaxID=2498107 RepID=UPI000F8D4F6C|nr:type II toxin-antitoxin system HigB family toxin [Legionella sp. km535]RUR19038.1 type II toxin-antitoxin system HigB family toxin [Legionella sp. km535]